VTKKYAMNVWTTKPPANESRAKSSERRITAERERRSGGLLLPARAPSTFLERPSATTTARTAATG
jgi:hypothetical protein